MTLITFAVPCFNSAAYMCRCIDSLLAAGDRIQIVIVDDGSTDDTGRIADDYASRYPETVEAVHQENGGHGAGVNAGLSRARGKYFKVVDSDDRLETGALTRLMLRIEEDTASGTEPDMYLTNFVYDKPSAGTRFSRRYVENFPTGRIFGWEEVKPFRFSNVLLMHSMVVRTDILRASGLHLPEHCFYVDNIFAYRPLPLIKTMYYLDVDLYLYFIGREDQSVTRANIVKRYRQQLRVMDELLRAYTYEELRRQPKALRRYMEHDISVLLCLTIMFTTNGEEDIPERRAALKAMWADLRARDKEMYRYLRHRSYAALIAWMPFSWQRFFTDLGYRYFSRHINCS